MPIRALTDITVGAVLVDTAGTHFHVIEEPMRDGPLVVRYYVSPLNRIGSGTPIYHAGACVAGNQYFDASKAIDGIMYAENYGQLPVAKVYKAGELDLSAIPFTIDPGLFELQGGGRLLVKGSEIYLGHLGTVSKLTLNAQGQFMRPDGSRFDPGITTATKTLILREARGFDSGTLFVANVAGVTRVFKRRSHGIKPADNGPRVAMGDLEGDLTALTTTEPGTTFRVGQVLQFSSAERAKIIQIDGREVSAVQPNGAVLELAVKESTLPPTSEFAAPEIVCGGYRVTVVQDSGTVFPPPRPIADLPQERDVIQVGRLRYSIWHSAHDQIRGQKLSLKATGHFVGTDAVKEWTWGDGEDMWNLVTTDEGIYGLPEFTKLGSNPEIPRASMEPGALYLTTGGARVAHIHDVTRFGGNRGSARDRVASATETRDPSNAQSIQIEHGRSRYVILRKLADAGAWIMEVQENGCFGCTMAGAPDTVVEVSGVKWPMTHEGERFLRRLLSLTCSRCQSPSHRDSMTNCYSANGVGLICAGCVDVTQRCPGCRASMDGTFNAYGVCPSCYATGNFEIIRNHSYMPELKFHGDGPLFYGSEVELVFRRDRTRPLSRNNTAKIAIEASDGLWYAKNDGSIGDGIEFVSHPFTLPWLLENKAKAKAIFDSLQPHMQEQGCCGIHIHTSKAGYGVLPSSVPNGEKLSPQRLLTRGLMRVQRFIYGNPKLTVHFAGRESHDYASLEVEGIGFNGDVDARATRVSEMKLLAENIDVEKDCRYSAMNMTEKTVEFRIFKSTVDFDEYLRNILFLDSVINYCRTHALPKNGSVGVKAYRKYLEADAVKYAPVIDHLDEFEGVKRRKSAEADFQVHEGRTAPVQIWDDLAPATPMAASAQALRDFQATANILGDRIIQNMDMAAVERELSIQEAVGNMMVENLTATTIHQIMGRHGATSWPDTSADLIQAAEVEAQVEVYRDIMDRVAARRNAGRR